MKRSTIITTLILCMLLAVGLPMWFPCPVCDKPARWTGAYEYVGGVRFAIYECPIQHRFDVKAPL